MPVLQNAMVEILDRKEMKVGELENMHRWWGVTENIKLKISVKVISD